MKMFEGKNMKLTDDIGDDHIATSAKTPLREDAFAIKDDEKIQSIEKCTFVPSAKIQSMEKYTFVPSAKIQSQKRTLL